MFGNDTRGPNGSLNDFIVKHSFGLFLRTQYVHESTALFGLKWTSVERISGGAERIPPA
jgi:hypothetical protein